MHRSGGTLLSWNLRDSPRAAPAGCPFGGCPAQRPSITLQQCGRQSVCLSVQPSAVLRLSPDGCKFRRSGEKVTPERFPRETSPQRRCFSGAEADQTSRHRSNRPLLRNTRQATNGFLPFDRLADPTAGGQRQHRTPHRDTRPECGGEAHRLPRLVRTVESFSYQRLPARDGLAPRRVSLGEPSGPGLRNPFYLQACRDRTPKPRPRYRPPWSRASRKRWTAARSISSGARSRSHSASARAASFRPNRLATSIRITRSRPASGSTASIASR